MAISRHLFPNVAVDDVQGDIPGPIIDFSTGIVGRGAILILEDISSADGIRYLLRIERTT